MADEYKDYFDDDTDEVTEEQNQEEEEAPKTEVESPEEKEERELKESIEVRRRWGFKQWAILIAVLLFIGLCGYVWAFFWLPSQTTQAKGLVVSVVADGKVLKTYEGTINTDAFSADSIRYVTGDFKFSVTDTAVVHKLINWQSSGLRVVATYEVYDGGLFWRGDSKNIVTKVELDTTSIVAGNPHYAKKDTIQTTNDNAKK